MKHLCISTLILLLVCFSIQTQAQKSVQLTITKEANGVTTVIDTSFTVDDAEEVEDVLRQMGIEEPKENQTLEKRIVIRDIAAPRSSRYVEITTDNPMIGVFLAETHHEEHDHHDGHDRRDRDYDDDDYEGVVVTGLTKGGGAQTAGIQKGDVILRVDGEVVESIDDVHDAKEGFKPGETISVQYSRDGRVNNVLVTLGAEKEKFSNYRPHVTHKKVKKAFLGVVPYSVTEEKARRLNLNEARGVYISEIVKGEGAEAAGLEEGDVIVRMANQEVYNNQDLREVLSNQNPGDDIRISYIRDGRTRSTTATLGMREKTVSQTTHRYGEMVKEKRALLGVYLETDGDEGVRVTKVTKNGAAEQAGMEKGDVITRIGSYDTPSYKALVKALRSHQPGDRVDIDFIRDDRRRSTTATLKEKVIHKWVPKDGIARTEIDVDVIIKTFENREEGESLRNYMNNPSLALDDFSIYPNPNSGRFNVRFTVENDAPLLIKIFNSKGQVVYQEQLTDFYGGYDKEIDISDNAKGVYFIQITQNGRGVAKRISVL